MPPGGRVGVSCPALPAGVSGGPAGRPGPAGPDDSAKLEGLRSGSQPSGDMPPGAALPGGTGPAGKPGSTGGTGPAERSRPRGGTGPRGSAGPRLAGRPALSTGWGPGGGTGPGKDAGPAPGRDAGPAPGRDAGPAPGRAGPPGLVSWPRRGSGGPDAATSQGAEVVGDGGANEANGSGTRCAVSCGSPPSGMGAGSHGGPPGGVT